MAEGRGWLLGSLGLIALYALADHLTGRETLPPTAVVMVPLLASSALSPRHTAIVGVVATAFVAVTDFGEPSFLTAAHAARIGLTGLGGAVAVWAARRRQTSEEELLRSQAQSLLSETFQRGLLTLHAPTSGGVQVVTRYHPGEDMLLLGGDFIDIVDTPRDEVAFIVGDVKGHGPEAAAIGAALRASWRALALVSQDPVSWMVNLERLLLESRPDEEMFVTCGAGVIAPDGRGVRLVSAGHPPPILLGDRAHEVDLDTGPPLGVVAQATWPVTPLPLRDPWALMVYSDGLTDCRVAPGSSDRLGVAGLVARTEAVAGPRGLLGDGRLDRLIDTVRDAGGGTFDDDVAVLLLTPRPVPAPRPTANLARRR